MAGLSLRRWFGAAVAALAVAAAVLAWRAVQPEPLPDGFAASNGRIEAVEIDVAARTPGRVAAVLVEEGDLVRAGDVLARLDTANLDAQYREAEAQRRRAAIGVETARSQVQQREAEVAAARAVVRQREAERDAAAKTLARTREMAEKGTTSQQNLDEAVARFEGARAAVSAAEAQVAAAQAALGFARSEVVAAEAAAAAAAATVERIAADIDDCVLRSPRDGRVQYRVAQPGEVVAAGAAVLNLVDLGHVYMTFFLPTAQAGRIALGAEARIVLDAAPEFVIPASVSYVADVAQFTPKTVETADEREKLMFRIKASIDPALLDQYLDQVKTGLPGMVYVRLDAARAWPDELQVALPP